MPDLTRGGRIVLADYVSGKLLHVTPPPEIPRHLFAPFEEQLAAHGIDMNELKANVSEIEIPEKVVESKKEEKKKPAGDFQLIDPLGETKTYDPSYMHHKQAAGRKMQRRLKEKTKYENAVSYSTDNIHRRKKGHQDAQSTLKNSLPIHVKAVANKQQINLQVKPKES